jgi:hypothetical protein
MQTVKGNKDVRLIECTNPARKKYRIRWNIEPENEDLASYMEEEFDHLPGLEEINRVITGWYNDRVSDKIRSGFVWKEMPVWLSQENQFNYKTVYDLAVQTKSANLPVEFKFGTSENPVYYEFATLAELKDFYTKSVQYIQDTLKEGWVAKDAIDWDEYLIK